MARVEADGGSWHGSRWNWRALIAVIVVLILLVLLVVMLVTHPGDGAVSCGPASRQDSTITPKLDAQVATVWCTASGRPEFPILFVRDQLIVEQTDADGASDEAIRNYISRALTTCNGGREISLTTVDRPEIPAEKPGVDTVDPSTTTTPAAAAEATGDGTPAPSSTVFDVGGFTPDADTPAAAAAAQARYALCVGGVLHDKDRPSALVDGKQVFIDLNYVHALTPGWSFKPAYDPSENPTHIPSTPAKTITKLTLPSSVPLPSSGSPSVVVIDTGYPDNAGASKPQWLVVDGGSDAAYTKTSGIATLAPEQQVLRHGPFIVSQLAASAVTGSTVSARKLVLARLGSQLTLPYFDEADLLDTIKRVFGYGQSGTSWRFGAVAGAKAPRGATVVDMSFGSDATSGPPFAHTPLTAIFARLLASGGWTGSAPEPPVVVAAAGNDGVVDATRLPAGFAVAGTLDQVAAALALPPGSNLDRSVLAVGAAYPGSNPVRSEATAAPYSNRGSAVTTWMPGDCYGAVPGWNGKNWQNESWWWGGTSFATANAASAVIAKWPTKGAARAALATTPALRSSLPPAPSAEITCF